MEYEVTYKMKHRYPQKMRVNASNPQEARATVKSMMGPDLDHVESCILVSHLSQRDQ